ncbi:MAG: M36 family metallopeptidase [Candidatus Xenobia bacterium]
MLSSVRALAAPPAPAPAPPPPKAEDADFSYNSQDDLVMPTTTLTVHNVTKGAAPSVDKAQLGTDLAPNAEGKYVFAQCDPKSVAAQTFATTARELETFQKAWGHPIQWAFGGDKLTINPDAGEDFNAYYTRDGGSTNFFHGTDPVTGAVVMSGASGEVVSHETGHAILDSIRPNYLGSFNVDPGAFHESFGDMMGIIMSMLDDRSAARAAIETGGDLSKPNCIAMTGEDLGVAINDVSNKNVTGGPYVRNANNSFKWQDPSTLPDPTGPDQLGNEVHDFSRLWTGAFFDVIKAITAEKVKAGTDPKAAIQATGQEALQILVNQMKAAPQGDFTYKDMAQACIDGDKKFNGGKRADLLKKVFTDRAILPADAPPPPPKPGRAVDEPAVRSVPVRLHGAQFGQFDGALVDVPVDNDGSLEKDSLVADRTRTSLQRLIAQGRVKYMEPNQQPKPSDCFDAKGQPYTGIVRWENGEMHIERVKVVS